jgi:hypothetical protein
MRTDASFTEADLRLIARDYKTLDEVCSGRDLKPAEAEDMIGGGLLPQPAYVLPDGRRMFSEDYLQLYDETGAAESLEGCFRRRFIAAAKQADLDFTEEWNPDSEWADYLDGTYWACLYNATPEVIIEKERQIRAITRAISRPEPESARWRESLRSAVQALDSIERAFTDFDRERWDYTSRERYISAPKAKYPEVFEPKP